MAKLEGVKTLDMVGGDITKVEYNDAVYEKVEGRAEEGDIGVVISNNVLSMDKGDFFHVLKDGHYYDNDGDLRDANYQRLRRYYVFFRKVPAPTIEQVDAKVDALAERVDALEGERHVYAKPHTLREGDRVKALVNGQFENIDVGDIGVVSDCDAGIELDPYSIRVVTKNDVFDYFRPQDLELVEDQSYKPTKGDIVVITANTNNSRNKVGDIGKVGGIGDVVARVDVPNRPSKASEYGNWTLFSEMRPATDEEKAQYEQAVKFGRQPNEFKKGDIVRVMDDDDYPELIGKFVEVYGENEGIVGGGNVYVTEDRKIILGEDLELVVPIESRVDR